MTGIYWSFLTITEMFICFKIEWDMLIRLFTHRNLSL